MRKFYFLFIILLLAGCKKWDKPEQATSYIYIERIDLDVLPTEGSSANDICDAWVYVNDQAVGVFDLPCTVPILAEGKQKITIAAGIKDDGMNNKRTKYPFYQFYITNDIDLKRGEVIDLTGTLQPTVNYYSSSDIDIWYENFDDGSINFVADPNSEVGFTHIADSVNSFEGKGMGKIELPDGYNFAQVLTAESFTLPKMGLPVYVELNYKTNNEMVVGIQAIDGTETTDISNTVIRTTDGVWKKMYINLTTVVSQQSNADSFKFFIAVSKQEGVTVVENFIDNFKVVYDK